MDYSPNSYHRIRFGLEGILNRFKPEVVSFNSNDGSANSEPNAPENDTDYQISTKTLSGWLEDDWEISDRVSINGGLRYTIYNTQGHLFQQLQPRFSARYQFLDNWSFKSSYAKTQQNVHLLTSSGINLPTDLWLPSTKKVPPEKAQQLATGVAGTILDGEYLLEVEGFYKWYDDLIEYREGSSLANQTADWENQVATQGIGWSYGMELFLRKQFGRLNGWASYTLSWSERQFDNINFGKSFPYKYDRRHNLKLTGSYKINDNIDFTAKWVFRTSAPTTIPFQEYRGVTPSGELTLSPVPWHDYQNITIDNYGARNTVRMRNYHRLDVSFNFHKEKEHGERTWTVGLINVYNRHNPFYMYLDYNYQTQKTNIKEVSILPILPMVTYKFEFAQ